MVTAMAQGHGHGGHGGHGDAASTTPPALPAPVSVDARFFISKDGLAASPLVDGVLADRVRDLSREPANEAVLLLAHGPGDDEENARWLSLMEARASGVRALGAFRAVRCETLREDWPAAREAAQARVRAFVEEQGRAGARVLVVPFRVSGFGPYASVLEGLTYERDDRGLLPHANITTWLSASADAAFAASPGVAVSSR
jgi:hypothetical protein